MNIIVDFSNNCIFLKKRFRVNFLSRSFVHHNSMVNHHDEGDVVRPCDLANMQKQDVNEVSEMDIQLKVDNFIPSARKADKMIKKLSGKRDIVVPMWLPQKLSQEFRDQHESRGHHGLKNIFTPNRRCYDKQVKRNVGHIKLYYNRNVPNVLSQTSHNSKATIKQNKLFDKRLLNSIFERSYEFYNPSFV